MDMNGVIFGWLFPGLLNVGQHARFLSLHAYITDICQMELLEATKIVTDALEVGCSKGG